MSKLDAFTDAVFAWGDGREYSLRSFLLMPLGIVLIPVSLCLGVVVGVLWIGWKILPILLVLFFLWLAVLR